MNLIGNRIRSSRESKAMSQEQLGKNCGTTKQTIFKYEAGIISNIPMDRISTIAKVLDVDPSYLMGWTDNPLRNEHADWDFEANVEWHKGIELDNQKTALIQQESKVIFDDLQKLEIDDIKDFFSKVKDILALYLRIFEKNQELIQLDIDHHTEDQ